MDSLFASAVLLPSHSSAPPPQDGYWEFTPDLGKLLNLDADLFANVFLKSKGIDSLGERPLGPFQPGNRPGSVLA